MDNWITVRDAAKLRDCSVQAMQKLISKGRFDSVWLPNEQGRKVRHLDRNQVLNYSERPPGRPPVLDPSTQ